MNEMFKICCQAEIKNIKENKNFTFSNEVKSKIVESLEDIQKAFYDEMNNVTLKVPWIKIRLKNSSQNERYDFPNMIEQENNGYLIGYILDHVSCLCKVKTFYGEWITLYIPVSSIYYIREEEENNLFVWFLSIYRNELIHMYSQVEILVLKIMAKNEEEGIGGVYYDKLITKCKEKGLSEDSVENAIDILLRR